MNDYARYQFYFNIFQFLLTCAVAAGAWYRTREKADTAKLAGVSTDLQKRLDVAKSARDEQCKQHKRDTSDASFRLQALCETLQEAVNARLNGHNDRLQQHKELIVAIEAEFKHLPKSKDLATLHEKINGVNTHLAQIQADVGKLSGVIPGLTNITNMMNDFLLHQGGK